MRIVNGRYGCRQVCRALVELASVGGSLLVAFSVVKQHPAAASGFSFIFVQKSKSDAKSRTAVGATPFYTYYSSDMQTDSEFMALALEDARRAGEAGEVPIGALVVYDENIVARSGNRTIRDCDPTAHAEIISLRQTARIVSNYRLSGATLYVTLEPCIMCAGAMIQARITRVVYGADDPKGGAARSCFRVFSSASLNHQIEFASGVLAAESAALLQSFFAARR